MGIFYPVISVSMSSAKPYSPHKCYHLKNATSLPSNTISEFYFKKFGYFGYQDLLRDLARNVRSLTTETSRDNEVFKGTLMQIRKSPSIFLFI